MKHKITVRIVFNTIMIFFSVYYVDPPSPSFQANRLIIKAMKRKIISVILFIWALSFYPVCAQIPTTSSEDKLETDPKTLSLASAPNLNPDQSTPTDAPSRYVFALAAPFTTTTDNISFDQLADFWSNGFESSPDFPIKEIIIDSKSESILESIFKTVPGESIKIVSAGEVLTQIYAEDSWTILPFEKLEPRYKVIRINEQSPLENDFNLNNWPLTALIGGTDAMSAEDWAQIPAANRDPNKLTTVMLTGVTAMVRGTGQYMDVWGPEYPGKNIRDILRSADILHVNNEVPFAPVCQQSQDELNNLVFCSKKAYIDLLTDIGTDVVELDGDHFQDYGDEAVLYTLDLYKQNNIPYYGGGSNIREAQKPLIMEHNGNRFAFIGCNGKDIGYAAASESRPGAVHCDIPLIVSQIKSLKSEGIIPIVTFQHIEYYHIAPNDEMRSDFEAVADAGAVIVSGSQSHIPMAFEITQKAFIHYGLGNLFFDQAFFLPETSEATLDIHVFYDGKHIGSDIQTIKFTNLALNRLMTEEERIPVLDRIFAESRIDLPEERKAFNP